MVLTDRITGGGRAGQFLRCNAAYRTAWRRRHPQPGLPKQAPFQVRLQTVADLAASRSWADPDEEDGPIPSFWLEAPLLPAAISPNSTQLRIAAGSGLGPADGVQAQHDILLSPAAFSSQLREACALTGWEVPRWGGHGAAPPHRTGAGPQALRCPGTNAKGAPGLRSCGSRGGSAGASMTMPRLGTASGSE